MSAEWLRAEFHLALPAALEAVTYWGHQWGSGGLEVADGPDGAVVIVHLPAGERGQAQLASLREQLDNLTAIFGGPVLRTTKVTAVAATDWAEGWKQYYGPLPIGRQFVVVPSWLRTTYVDPAGRRPLYLDPGLAFGTGEHTTTRQALLMLERTLAGGPRTRVLDVGTGSGILAIAAARLGAAAVLALDIDPVAVSVAAENVAANGFADRVKVVEADVATVAPATLARHWPAGTTAGGARVGGGGELVAADADNTPAATAAADGTADVVVSNILLDVLVQRAAPLAALVRPGGSLILAGVLVKEEHLLQQAFTAQGMVCTGSHRDGEWLVTRFQPLAPRS